MFDNPNEELKKLEKKLLAVEERDEDFEAFYENILREFGPETSKTAKKTTTRRTAPARPTYADAPRHAAPVRREKGVSGLIVTLCMEFIGIALIIFWWVLRILR